MLFALLFMQQWTLQQINETTGSAGYWPYNYTTNPPGNGQGWWCSGSCFLPAVRPPTMISSANQINYRRNLRTYVNGLLSLQYNYPQSYQEVNDAILVDMMFGLGTYNPNTTAFVHEFNIQPANYSWSYSFHGRPTPMPTAFPTTPTIFPSAAPTTPTPAPTLIPSRVPTAMPSNKPSKEPTAKPSRFPTKEPSVFPSKLPTVPPSRIPSKVCNV